MSYGGRVDELLDLLGDDLTEADFRELAMACVDQAGVGLRDQAAIRRILEADALGRDAIAARIADLPLIEPAPGWEDRAVERWRRSRQSAAHLRITPPGAWQHLR